MHTTLYANSNKYVKSKLSQNSKGTDFGKKLDRWLYKDVDEKPKMRQTGSWISASS